MEGVASTETRHSGYDAACASIHHRAFNLPPVYLDEHVGAAVGVDAVSVGDGAGGGMQ